MPTGGFINQWGEFEMYDPKEDEMRDVDDDEEETREEVDNVNETKSD